MLNGGGGKSRDEVEISPGGISKFRAILRGREIPLNERQIIESCLIPRRSLSGRFPDPVRFFLF